MLIAAEFPVLAIEYHRSFIPSTLISKPAGRRNKIQDSHQESNPGPPALAAGALTTGATAPHSHPGNFTPALRVIDNPIPKLMLKESTRIIKSSSIEHQHQ